MLMPANCPMIAATATASPPTKKLVQSVLKMHDNCHHENLGNFHDNMTHKIYHMHGGQKSYHEVCDLLPSSLADLLANGGQIIVFVNDNKAAHAVAAAIRKYYALFGKEARDLVAAYHSPKNDPEKRCIERRY
jgi:superfamily II DNA/RNA helicase